jgi:hypothetical protein
MAINAICNGIPFPKGEGISSSIKKAMVLWYDLKRQGATNETMKANPKLIDLSGNGHDATCYNFAWSGMSSIGGYVQVNFDDTHTIQNNAGWKYLFSVAQYVPQEFQMKVICKNPPIKTVNIIGAWNEGYESFSEVITTIKINEVQTIPILNLDPKYKKIHISYNNLIGYEVTTKQIPEYPNTLVADGVDDYALCSTLPTLDDFTIVAKRKILNDSFCFASASDVVNKGAFVLESDYSTQFMVYSFGAGNSTSRAVDDIIYMTPTSYNGTAITRGTNNEGNNLNLFRVRNGDSRYMKGVLYSFILFNRTLTTKEINWVKHNLIEGDTEL